MKKPTLASKVYTDHGETYRITVHGGLHYIRGNSAPYFTITADQYRKCGNGRWVEDSFGCLHELIERLWPGKFTDLIAMHLSHIDGEPTHSAENGWYFARGGTWFGARWLDADGPKYGTPATFRDSVRSVMRHFRINRKQAIKLVALGRESVRQDRQRHAAADWDRLNAVPIASYGPRPLVDGGSYKGEFMRRVATYTERFSEEAQACIDNHGLVVFGDKWQAAA